MDTIITVFEQGFIFSILALGSYVSYKILKFPDLSVEGTFPLGAAITALMIVNDYNPYVALIVSIVFGALAGLITGFIHVKLKVTDLLSGIIVLTALYSTNLLIAKKSNLPIFDKVTIFNDNFSSFLKNNFGQYYKLILTLFIVIIIKILLDFYFKSKSGLLLRAAGDNQQFTISLNKDPGLVKMMGLALANGLSAFAGSVWCQYQRFFDVSMGTGMIIIGLSSVIIGQSIFKKFNILKGTTMTIIGAILYNACIAFAIEKGVKPELMKLMTSVLFLIVLVLSKNNLIEKLRSKKYA